MANLVNKKSRISLEKNLSLIGSILELNKDDAAKNDLELIKELLIDEPELSEILTDPFVKEDKKNKLIDNIFKGNVSDKIIDLIKKIFVRNDDVTPVVAITAVPMDKNAQDRLVDILQHKLNKNIAFFNEVDKNIIGGVLLKVGDKLLDGTFQTQLNSIEKTLKNVSLYEKEV
jgi:F-type H+-transporting ATPase subunit delta